MANNSDESVGLFFLGIGILAIWLIFFDGWHSKLRYSIEYSIPYDQVKIDQKAHDCEWETAPIGNKNCHYEAEVMTVHTSISTENKQIYSYDEGKTWLFNEAVSPAKPSATIYWKKIED